MGGAKSDDSFVGLVTAPLSLSRSTSTSFCVIPPVPLQTHIYRIDGAWGA